MKKLNTPGYSVYFYSIGKQYSTGQITILKWLEDQSCGIKKCHIQMDQEFIQTNYNNNKTKYIHSVVGDDPNN